ncbi:MAG TPA: hypothetical protein VIM30_13235 [Candidatus Limnocylindrales bacterium]|jgi:uncharacterized membrane protein YphA (DoxX/SURF4 family)
MLTGGAMPPSTSLPVLAVWETLIGLGLLSGRFLRATLFLLAVQGTRPFRTFRGVLAWGCLP